MARSSPPDHSVVPSGLKASAFTRAECPVYTARRSPLATSQSITRRSSDPDASVFPSGLKTSRPTRSRWPARVARGRAVATLNRPMVTALTGSREAASVVPSGLTAIGAYAPAM